MTKDEALKLAMEYMTEHHYPSVGRQANLHHSVITAIKQALNDALHLAAPVQEPVVAGSLSVRYFRGCKSMTNTDFDYEGDLPEGDYTLYTTPPAAQPALKPLTDEALTAMFGNGINGKVCKEVARMIEAAHGIKEKNT